MPLGCLFTGDGVVALCLCKRSSVDVYIWVCSGWQKAGRQASKQAGLVK